MAEGEMQRCDRCRFWRLRRASADPFAEAGDCRRFPPARLDGAPDRPASWRFPLTIPLEWCGEVRPISPPS